VGNVADIIGMDRTKLTTRSPATVTVPEPGVWRAVRVAWLRPAERSYRSPAPPQARAVWYRSLPRVT
jgi:hypothetical protein